MRRPLPVLAALAALATGPACNGNSSPGGLRAEDAWVRLPVTPPTPADSLPRVNSAAYLLLHNTLEADDALVGVEASEGGTAEIHQASLEGGVMRMRPVRTVTVPAGGQLALEPGGYHIMLVGLTRPLAEGDTVALTLRFGSGKELHVAAPVRRRPPQ